MPATIFVSNSENPSSFHKEDSWVPAPIRTLISSADEPGQLERFVFSVLVQDALDALEQKGEVLELCPFPLFNEASPPKSVIRLEAYLDEYVFQRLHFVKQAMFPNHKVGTDEFVWSLCQSRLRAAGLAPVEQLPATVAKKTERRAPVSQDFQFSNLYREVYEAETAKDAVSHVAEPGPHQTPDEDRSQLCLVPAVSLRKLLSEVSSEDPRFAYLGQMSSRKMVPLAMSPDAGKLSALRRDCPNFEPVLEFVERHACLCESGQVPFTMPPLLLLGPPGVGKTYFARMFGRTLGVDFKFIPMNSVSAGFTLTGMHRTWQKATPGLVVKTLLDSHYGNPLLMLDEIDKSTTNGQHGNPVDALYQLLEPETSESFVDEFFDVPVNASKVVWVATANDASSLPEPLLSRFKVFALPALAPAQALFVATRVLREICQRYRLEFSDNLDQACAKKLGSLSARDLRILLLDAVGNALREGRHFLSEKDLDTALSSGSTRKAGIGFVA